MLDKRFPHTYSSVLEELTARVEAPGPGRVQILTGPRQVGKTHLLLKLVESLGWRAAPLEVDMTISGSWGRWAVEVKTGRFSSADLAGLLELCRRRQELAPLVLCDPGHESGAQNAGVEVMTWQDYLLHGPPNGSG